ncbi:MAG: branched-chain amino acid ABC transporter permease [Candidatus Aenigmarchaeota archaeon]|nr:branched-chain amino acid ABC transporter permease [Candidatus Aenigmarchaeota archaeon]
MLEEILIIGALTSSIFALLALGFTLIYGVARLIVMCHTAFYMMAAYFIYTFTKLQGLNTIIAVFLAVAITTLLGMGIYQLFIHRVREHEMTVLIITVAIALIFQESIKLWISGEYLGVDPFISGFIEVFGVRIAWQDVFIITATSILVVVLWVVITKTGLGIAIRATAQDPEVANLMGINTGQIYLISMGLAALLAAIAGALIAPRYVLVPLMWMHPLILVLSIIVLGGLGNLKGSIIAAFILGYAETSVVFLLPMGSFLKGAVALTVMITVLVIRPEGLFGVSFEEERL